VSWSLSEASTQTVLGKHRSSGGIAQILADIFAVSAASVAARFASLLMLVQPWMLDRIAFKIDAGFDCLEALKLAMQGLSARL
jgi:hypothetical protein